jgi:hypothetical protein
MSSSCWAAAVYCWDIDTVLGIENEVELEEYAHCLSGPGAKYLWWNCRGKELKMQRTTFNFYQVRHHQFGLDW